MNRMCSHVRGLANPTLSDLLLHREIPGFGIAANEVVRENRALAETRSSRQRYGSATNVRHGLHRNTGAKSSHGRVRACTGSAEVGANRITIKAVPIHVDLLRIQRETGTHHQTFGRSIRNPNPWRKQLLRNLNVTVGRVQRYSA